MAGMVPEDVYELTGVSDPRLSPDGRTVAFVVWRVDASSNEYRSAIWTVPADGSAPAAPFTAGLGRDASPRWAPDGTMLAFTSNRDSKDHKAMDVFVIPVAGGEPRRLSRLKESAGGLAWSPDGSRLVFTSRVPDAAYDEEDDKKRRPRRFTRLWFKLDNVGWTGDRRQHLFLVDANAGGGENDAIQLTDGNFEDADPAWSPDGRSIAFSSAREEDWDIMPVSDIYVVDLGDPSDPSSREPRRVTRGEGAAGAPSWSPDGSTVAYVLEPGVWDSPRHGQIATVPATGGAPTILTDSLDRNCSPYPGIREPIWELEGTLLFAIEDQGNTHLYRVPADGSGKPELVVGGERMVSGHDAAGGEVVFSAGSPTSLDELHTHDDLRLTDVGAGFRTSRDLVAPERFTAVSGDGTEVEAWLIRPAGFQSGVRYPVLLNVHGGPFTQYGNKLFDEFQVQAGAGYAVLYSNPRGSSGYSEDWSRAIRGLKTGGPGFGTVDFEDVMAVADTALERFAFLDADRMGILGGSYGGFMTTWAIGHTDRFKAACSERALNEWLSFRGSSDISEFFRGYFGAFAFEDPDGYRRMSPHTYATDIHTPLLILHSETDLRCPIEQGEQLFTTLRLLKRDVEMVRFPSESHELSRSGNPVHRVMRFEIILEWFDRYLK